MWPLNDVVCNLCLIGGHNPIYGLTRWTMSEDFRLIDGHNLIDGLKQWTMSDIFRLIDGHILNFFVS
jgi:hypothetical protein